MSILTRGTRKRFFKKALTWKSPVYPKLCVKSEERRKTEQKIIYLGRADFPASLFCSISGNRVHVKGGGLSRRGIYP